MKIAQKQAIGENLLYLMVWLAIILVPVLNSKMMSELHVSLENVLTTWRKIVPYLTIFLVHNFLICRYLLRKQHLIYALLIVLLNSCVFGVVEYFQKFYLFNEAEINTASDLILQHKATFTDLEMYWNVVLGIFMCGANSGIKLMYQSIRDEQEMKELKQQNMLAEMDYLKYQINPHFFMNTLNNIHALIDIDTESAKNAVIELSKMMRYVLYDSEHQSISLDRDIQFLRNYIELMRIRYSEELQISVEAPDIRTDRIKIPPLLLIVFVENAFKHGVASNRPSFIRIRIDCTEERVKAIFVNSRRSRIAEPHKQGIGLSNVRKRLGLIYGEKNFVLDIREDETTYTLELEIPTLHA